ncbi:MAG: DUF5916 domain-containing protein [Gemmatimonadales bacterium]
MTLRKTPFILASLITLPAPLAGQGSQHPGVRVRTELGAGVARPAVTAVPLSAEIRVDGVLDEAVWRTTEPATGFVQSEPDEGQPASERTEVWVAYDDENLYVAAHLYDSEPDALVVSDIRRDFRIDNQDTFEVILDTFADRRNGYLFATNPAGARADQQVTNEGRAVNPSWDAPWIARAGRTADGWTAELAIPFSAIRSAGAGASSWGINFSRRIRRKNEIVFWSPIPRAYALTRLSLAGDLVGLRGVRSGRDMRFTPYVLGRTIRETGGSAFDRQFDGGLDAKLGVTRGLTLDLTVNADFAQAEADVQQVNLTQFSQFFPEKRDFFLENSGLFYVGDAPRNTRLAVQPRGDEDLLLFFSRRMGLGPDRRPVGIDAGLRLTGQEGDFQIGALALRTRDRDTIPGSDYAAVRVRRNILANSDVGALFMMRSNLDDRGDFNRLYGADANIRLPSRIDWSSYFVQSETDGLTGSRYAYQTSFNREANFTHIKFGLLTIAENFNDELGFLRRTGVRVWSVDTGIRPRLASLRRSGVREMHPHIVWRYYTDFSGGEVAKRFHSGYTFFFNSGGFTELSVNHRGEVLTRAFPIHPDVTPLRAARYDWVEWMLRGFTDPSRAISVGFTGILGGLWNGTQRTANVSLTFLPSYRLRATLGVQRTDARLEGAGQRFVREIWTLRANYSFTPNMFVDALAQYDADRDRLNANVRFNLIHHPLSDLFIVYNEQRFTTDGGPAPGRSVILKFTQMVSF